MVRRNTERGMAETVGVCRLHRDAALRVVINDMLRALRDTLKLLHV